MVRRFRKSISSLIPLKKFIYLISPSKIYKRFYIDLEKTLASNKVKFFQLRFKTYSKRKIKEIGKKIKKITSRYKVKLIINDSAEITKLINADGCHLGQSDDRPKYARSILKKKIIGITCHNSKKLIKLAIKNKASYIAIGSFFKSKLKPRASKANLKILKWSKKNIKIPIVAIGGINDKNYYKLINAGANYIALSSFIWKNPKLKPEHAIKKF